MFRDAFSAAWLMLGYLVLLVWLGVLTARLGKLKKSPHAPWYLGPVFWLVGIALYLVFARVGEPDAIILITVSLVAPLLYFINLLIILLDKKHPWKTDGDKRLARRDLLIFLVALALWVIGLILI